MRVRLRTKAPVDKPARVDRETGDGVIRGASIITKGEALGHGFWIDETTLDQVAKLADGAAGRWTHGDMCADGLGTHLGRWKNVRREGDSVLGDFHFSPLAKNVKPEGLGVDAPTYLMDAAEKEPDVVGVSAVLDIERFDDSEVDEDGDEEPRKLARLSKVPRADYVADPAANPDGLFGGTPSELAERYAAALSAATETHGRERVVAFLRAWLASDPSSGEFRVGDRVRVRDGAGHGDMDGMSGEVAEISAERALAIKFDDMEELHRWYVSSELEPAKETAAAMSSRLSSKTPEARVTIEELKKKHAEELAAKDAQLAALNATVGELKAADEKRKADEIEAYVASLSKAAAPNAIEAKKLEHVRALLKAGHGDAARVLGDALLESAKGGKQEGDVHNLGAKDPQVESDEVIAANLRASGWKVEQDAKGRIVSKTPPQKAGR